MLYDNGLPGVRAEQTSDSREVMWAKYPQYIPGGRTIDGAKSRDPLHTGYADILRVGLVLGKITASGKYATCIIGSVTADYTSGGTELTVSAVTAAEIVRRIGASGTFKLTHAPTATGTVVPYATVTFSAVDTTTGVLTVTNLGVNVETGALVGVGDGSEIPLCILDEATKVTDMSGANIDVRGPKLLIAGLIDTDQIIAYPAAANTTLRAWLKAKLSDGAVGSMFQFKDNF